MALYNIRLNNRCGGSIYVTRALTEMFEGYNLYQIDNVTSKLEDKQDFFKKIDKEMKNFFPTVSAWLEKSKDENVKKKLIFNDEFVYEISSLACQKKSSKLPYNELKEYIEYIKKLSLDKECLELMKKSNVFPKLLKTELENYNRVKNIDDMSDIFARELPEIEKAIDIYLCQYSTFRQVRVWEKDYFKQLELENNYNYQINENISSMEKTEKDLEEENLIRDRYIRELYEKYDGDIEMMIEIMSEERLDELSLKDQDLIGYTDYKKRQR